MLHHDVQNGIILSNRTLVIQNTNRTHSGEYTCEANNGVGTGRSNVINLKIKRKSKIQKNFIIIIIFSYYKYQNY